MNQNDKFDMLSVVAFGIHTKVRRLLEEEVADASAETELRDVLRPFFFYEYFLDPPVVFGRDASAVVAFAPFLGRLAAQSEFMPVPWPGGYEIVKGMKKEEAEDIAVFGNLRVPTTRSNINRYWSRHVTFNEALTKSDVLQLLYRFWLAVERAASLDTPRTKAGDAIEQCRNGLTEVDKKPYVEVPKGFADYSDGIVSISAGWSELFAKDALKNLVERYEKESIDNALREYYTCIYPWLQDPAYVRKEPQQKGRLFELMTCSISSRRLFFGELILIYPPITNKELRLRAATRLRRVLHKAAVELYVPMLTLYEEFAAECDLKEDLFDNLPLLDPAKENAHKEAWIEKLPNRYGVERWSPLNAFLGNIGRDGGCAEKTPEWPAETPHIEFVDPVCNPFVQLIQFIAPATADLNDKLKKLQRELEAGADGVDALADVQTANGVVASCLDVADTRVGVAEWSRVLTLHTETIAKWTTPPKRSDVEGLRHDLLRTARQANCVLSDMEIALARLWAHRLAVMHEEPWAVEESLIFEGYLIASPGMIRCIHDAIRICHTLSEKPKKQKVQTALVVGGPGSGKDSMARLVRLFSPGYRFGRELTLNMATFRPKDLAVPLLLGLGAKVESGDPPGQRAFGLTGVIKQAVLDKSGPAKQGFSFILDELNSLDIDSQGALLRVFENSELLPLGGMSKDRIAFLFIGVMNEDPELIMKKRALDTILRQQTLLGGLLGDALYEMFRNQRRLRDDLYYRLARGGEIRIPDLRDRREDLPILTYFIVRDYLKDSSVDGRIDLGVYEELLNPALNWHGNIRELQAICRFVVDAALADNVLTPDGRLEIVRAHALRALGRITRKENT